MTIVVPPNQQYPIADNGFDSIEYVGSPQKNSTEAALTLNANVSITADIDYDNGTSEVAVVVPPLSRVGGAALHVVGAAFLDAIYGLEKNRTKRFF